MNLTGERTESWMMISQDEKDCRLIEALRREGWTDTKILNLLLVLKK